MEDEALRAGPRVLPRLQELLHGAPRLVQPAPRHPPGTPKDQGTGSARAKKATPRAHNPKIWLPSCPLKNNRQGSTTSLYH